MNAGDERTDCNNLQGKETYDISNANFRYKFSLNKKIHERMKKIK